MVVAALSITTTAWLAVTTTSTSLRADYTRNLTNISQIYADLSGFAATHPSWAGVHPLVASLARRYHTDVTLISVDGDQPLATTDSAHSPNPRTPAVAVVDVLHPQAGIGRLPLLGGIDPRAVGPFALSSRDRAAIDAAIDVARTCYERATGTVPPSPAALPNGREYVPGLHVPGCPTGGRAQLAFHGTTSEQAAAMVLTRAVDRCFGRTTKSGAVPNASNVFGQYVSLDPANADFQVHLEQLIRRTGGQKYDCVARARRTQLAPFVAPPARLYLSATVPLPEHGLSGAGLRKVVLVGGLILLATVGVCFVAATRLRRPLILMAGSVAATAAGSREERVPLRGTSEMVQLAGSVNDLSLQLAAAEQRRRDMVSDIAHELRTPVSSVRSWMEAVQDEVVEPDDELITRLLGELMALQHLIDDLQDLALADVGQLAVHPETVDVRGVVEQVVATVSGSEWSRVPVTTEYAGLTTADVDPARVRQIVLNLLANAQRATRSGRITVSVTGLDPELVITIADTGRGITAEDLPLLFDRFWRVDRSRSRRGGGTGLGLAIVQSLVHAHGGSITVESALQQGTVFTIRFPRTPPDRP